MVLSKSTYGQISLFVLKFSQTEVWAKSHFKTAVWVFSKHTLELAAIEAATKKFSDENKIGQGGYEGVYKCILPSGQEIAVKRLSVTSLQGALEFTNEAVLVAKLQHRNLVRLLGFCLEGQEKILVYEYIQTEVSTSFYLDWDNWKQKTPLELLDPTLRGSYSRNEVIRCIHIALLCIQENPSDRPSMANIVLMLDSCSVTLSLPRKPAYFMRRRTQNRQNNGVDSDQSTCSILWSANDASITEVYPR